MFDTTQIIKVILSIAFFAGSVFSQATAPKSPATRYSIKIVPDQLKFSGDIATKTNTLGYCTNSWLSNMPEGSIIIGVNPASCNPVDWNGGSVSAKVFLPNSYSPTVMVLKLSWPDLGGKGLYSPIQNSTGTITFDGQIIWSKSTTQKSVFNDNFYAAEHEPILTTIVITKPDTHTLTIRVPKHTAWDISSIELSAYPYPKIMKGIGYSAYRDCQYPGGTIPPSDQDIEEDLFRLFHTSTAIRTYGATGVNGRIPAIAKQVGLQVLAGAWIDGDESDDEQEIRALIKLANTLNLDGLIVGNEYYLRHNKNSYQSIQRSEAPKEISYLLNRILQVKKSIKNKNIPITTAEVAGLMFKWKDQFELKIDSAYKPILDQIDFILVHIYPFWDNKSIEGAAEYTVKQYKAIQALIEKEYPGKKKRVIIGETGWPSDGAPQGAAIPSKENQRRYLLEFLSLAEQYEVEYMYFDAFDELWKIEEGRVGQRWGYGNTNRTAKHSFFGVLLPSQQLLSINSSVSDDSKEPFERNDSKAFYVYNEWPMQPIKFSLTEQAFTKLKNEMPADVIAGLEELKDERYPNAKKLFETIESTMRKKLTDQYKSFIVKYCIENNHFIPSGWMGDTTSIKLFECDRSKPYKGEMSAQLSCSLPSRVPGWSGIYWLANDSWNGPGINLYEKLKVKKGTSIILTFWARGVEGGEVVKFKVGGVDTGNDSVIPAKETTWIRLDTIWTLYMIDLSEKDLSNVVGGFCWVTERAKNPGRKTIKIFLDDIKYEVE